jgi:alpha-1,3-rhamnosyl/mannosyltransferase
MILTPSEAVRRQAIERFRLTADRVVATALAASSRFRPVSIPEPETPFFLYVGTLEPRKNVGLVLDAWRKVREKHDVELVLAGKRRDDFPEIPASPGLRQLGAVADEELPALYSACVASVYPSWYEGFGLPVLEAMQCGAAVIASRDPAIVETAQDAAELVDVTSPELWVAAMTALIEKPERRAEIRSRAVKRAGEFCWRKTAQKTREVYAEAARRFRHKA